MTANGLNRLITKEINDNHPHWISSPLWVDIKPILELTRILFIDDIIRKGLIKDISIQIIYELDIIAKFFEPDEVLVTHKYVTDIFNHYLKLSVQNELFETSANIYNSKIYLKDKTQLFKAYLNDKKCSK